MKILIEVRDVYGKQTIYPACNTSRFFAALAGTKTLTHAALCLIEAQGYVIETIQPAFNLRKAG